MDSRLVRIKALSNHIDEIQQELQQQESLKSSDPFAHTRGFATDLAARRADMWISQLRELLDLMRRLFMALTDGSYKPFVTLTRANPGLLVLAVKAVEFDVDAIADEVAIEVFPWLLNREELQRRFAVEFDMLS